MSLTFLNSILALVIVSVIAVLTFTEAFSLTPLQSSKSSTVVKGDLLVDGANNKFGKYTWLPHEDGNTYIGPGKDNGSVILGKKEGNNKTILNGPLYFYGESDNTDTYKVEKKKFSHNNSELRFTINDDADEAVTIFGNSCATGNCGGEGREQHRFTATGEAKHKSLTVDGGATVNGILTANNDILVGPGKTIRSNSRMHINTGEILYLLPKSGVTIGKEWGGTGDLRVQGKLCVNDVCVDRNQLQKIKTAAKV
jgi:hypothetical protein